MQGPTYIIPYCVTNCYCYGILKCTWYIAIKYNAIIIIHLHLQTIFINNCFVNSMGAAYYMLVIIDSQLTPRLFIIMHYDHQQVAVNTKELLHVAICI